MLPDFPAKLTTEFYHLHFDLTRINNGTEINRIETDSKIENIYTVIFSNTHIGSDNILIKASATLSCANKLLKSIDEKKSEIMKKDFDVYFKNYKELINIMRKEMGVHSLSKENEKLFN